MGRYGWAGGGGGFPVVAIERHQHPRVALSFAPSGYMNLFLVRATQRNSPWWRCMSRIGKAQKRLASQTYWVAI